MEMTPNTGPNRFLVGVSGFIAGIGAQMLLHALITTFVGSIPSLWSKETLLLVGILLAPPILSHLFWTVEAGSSEDSFAQGLQLGALFWFIVVLVSLFTSGGQKVL